MYIILKLIDEVVVLKVKDFINSAQIGTKIDIIENVFFADGDSVSCVFSGTVGNIGKLARLEDEVSFFSICDNILQLNVSKID